MCRVLWTADTRDRRRRDTQAGYAGGISSTATLLSTTWPKEQGRQAKEEAHCVPKRADPDSATGPRLPPRSPAPCPSRAYARSRSSPARAPTAAPAPAPAPSRASAAPGRRSRGVRGLAWEDPEAVHLEVGEPDFPTPEHVVEAAHEAARTGLTRYAPNAGLPVLREALADKVARRNGHAARPEQGGGSQGGRQAR